MDRSPLQPAGSNRTAWPLQVGCAVLLIGASVWVGHRVVLQRELQALHQAARHRLEVMSARLDGHLARVAYLPSLLETSPEVMRLLSDPADPALSNAVSLHLRSLNALAGADNLYVLDRSGTTLAAGDFDRPGTPLGTRLDYRPYVRDALNDGRGSFYGVGITSARAGYYLSFALSAAGQVRGVAAVKVDLEGVEREWRGLTTDFLLIDEHQVAILSSRDAWRYRPLDALSSARREEAHRARRYGGSELVSLGWRTVALPGASSTRTFVDGTPFLASEQAVNDGRWRLVLLDDEEPAGAAARAAAFIAGLTAIVLLLAATLAWHRRRASRQRLTAQHALQAAHDSLELKVLERTAELRTAQDSLVHAGKLAVLGRMSAGMVHELNQPLAALQTLADNADLLIERGRLEEARGNLARIGQMVARLGRLTSQLKVFAHKSNAPVGRAAVHKVVGEALMLVGPRLRTDAIDVSLRIEPGDLAVAGEESRLEQVLTNLLVNAADAMDGLAQRRIDITSRLRDGCCEIVVYNCGPHIEAEIYARLFEPFVTSKRAGQGLGLGLMISAHTVRAFGGTLRARNVPPTGVEFTIELPPPAIEGQTAV